MPPPKPKPPRPITYFFLFLPYGAGSAYVSVTLGALAAKAGLPDGEIAGLAALFLLPHTWKFLWAPAVDWIGTPHRWYAGATLCASLAMAATGAVTPDAAHLGLLRTLVFLAGASTTLVAMATESLMAHLTPPEQKGAAAGWSQAGNVGGTTVGGLALLLAEGAGQATAAVTVAVALLACALPLLAMRAPPRALGAAGPGLRHAAADLLADLRGVFLSRRGALALLLCLLPIGSGGASALFSAMGPDWGASTELVATANGVAAGIASILGCLAGGRLSDLLEKKRAYVLAGVAVAAAALLMAVLPRAPWAYVATVLAYNFALGLSYAAFTAFALEVIGLGAAATKYNVLASVSNFPIVWMTTFDGWVADHHGRTAMLWTDGLAGLGGGALLLLAALLLLRGAPAPVPVAVPAARDPDGPAA